MGFSVPVGSNVFNLSSSIVLYLLSCNVDNLSVSDEFIIQAQMQMVKDKHGPGYWQIVIDYKDRFKTCDWFNVGAECACMMYISEDPKILV